jgi:hypothetical protein
MFGKNLVLGVVAFCGSLCNSAKKVGHKAVALGLAAVGMVVGVTSEAKAVVTLPDTGIEVSEYIDAAVTGLASVAAAAIGGYVAYTILKRAIRWIRTAMT